MGQYVRGDVILASLSMDEKSPGKDLACDRQYGRVLPGEVLVCPVSSKPPTDAPCIPISLDDFSQGGLDLFGESHVMISRVRTLRSGDVIGKKGRLTQEFLEEIVAWIPESASTASSRKNARGSQRRSG